MAMPIVMMPLRQLSKDLGVKRIDGAIGTTLFYHFLATMDYPHGDTGLADAGVKIGGVGYQGSWNQAGGTKLPKEPGEAGS
jgi:hypothetical protein